MGRPQTVRSSDREDGKLLVGGGKGGGKARENPGMGPCSNILPRPPPTTTNTVKVPPPPISGNGPSSPSGEETGRIRSGMFRRDSSNKAIVIYRNAKYNGVFGRSMVYLRTYAHVVALQWLAPLMSGCHNYLLQALGFAYVLTMLPLHSFLAFFLFLLRQIRLVLVRRCYPNDVICEDLSPRYFFMEKPTGTVTCILFTKGRMDVRKLRAYFDNKSNEIPILRQKLTDRFSLRVFTDLSPSTSSSGTSFDISAHVVEAPKKFHKFFVTHEWRHGDKSILEHFVSQCASESLKSHLPPWKITIIPQPVFNKEKTCCVLRFHHSLLCQPQIQQLLENLFTQPVYESVENSCCYWKKSNNNNNNNSFIPPLKGGNFNGVASRAGIDLEGEAEEGQHEESFTSLFQSSQNVTLRVDPHGEILVDFHLPFRTIRAYFADVSDYFTTLGKVETVLTTISDVKTWLHLQRKLLEFHPKAAVIKYFILDQMFATLKMAVSLLRNIPQSKLWADLRTLILQVLLILQAISFIPVEIISAFLNSYHNGFRKSEQAETRRVAWSAPISMELMEAIRSRTGVSTQSVILTACALALKDYYGHTNIKNPKKLGVLVPIVTKDLLAPTGYATVTLQTKDFAIQDQLQNIEYTLREKPPWKILGHYLLEKYLPYLFPRPVARVIQGRLFKRYPITFTQVNFQSPRAAIPLPHVSVWGQTVDEFMFWRLPQSDFCVSISLINYSETLRLSVLSPVKALDTVLTQRFCQNLNRIAEDVGVERDQIPYSRRSSPLSSSCPSPIGSNILNSM